MITKYKLPDGNFKEQAQIEDFLKVIELGMPTDAINKTFGVANKTISIYRDVLNAAIENDWRYFFSRDVEASNYVNVLPNCLCYANMHKGRKYADVASLKNEIKKLKSEYFDAIHYTQTEETKAEEKPAAEKNEIIYLAEIRAAVMCLPKILSALENMNQKITALNQRTFDPINQMSYTLQDIAENQDNAFKKIDRISRAVSELDGEQPITALTEIKAGFDDVCNKLDTIRYKIDKNGGK